MGAVECRSQCNFTRIQRALPVPTRTHGIGGGRAWHRRAGGRTLSEREGRSESDSQTDRRGQESGKGRGEEDGALHRRSDKI